MSENSAILAWFAVLSRVVDVLFSTEADKGQSHNICEIRNYVLKSEKIFQIVMFFGNHRWRVYQIWKTITNLNKIIESTNIIL